jgi:hypothetical protein
MKYRKSAHKTFVHKSACKMLVKLTPAANPRTLCAQLFGMKVSSSDFHFRFVLFLAQEYWRKICS